MIAQPEKAIPLNAFHGINGWQNKSSGKASRYLEVGIIYEQKKEEFKLESYCAWGVMANSVKWNKIKMAKYK